MTVYGDGKQTQSFQYDSDLVEGLIWLMEGEYVGPFNLSDPDEFTMPKIVQVGVDMYCDDGCGYDEQNETCTCALYVLSRKKIVM
nr:UDP-glucuronic acid decarboxylase 2 [Tanacetum cinerariifolium]